jgi:xanthine/uracil permease
VSATEEASFLSTSGPSHDKRVRGSLLNDGLSGIFSALATSLPLTTFAQNNGVISLTAVASRQAGWACAVWLFVLGVIAKFAGEEASWLGCRTSCRQAAFGVPSCLARFTAWLLADQR